MRRQTYGTGSSSPMYRAEKAPVPPFPKKQMLVLALCRICEPIAFMGIFPYIYYMVQDFHITEDETKIAMYAGMVTSAFTFAEFSTGILWGRLSDRIGRKPVLLTGLMGTALSVLLFGFAPSLPVALFARALGGLLNGNVGVLQTTVAEIITVKEHQPRAYTIMPLVWNVGSIVGPAIGGALASPCKYYPSLFPPGTIWERFPYLLPNLFSAAAVFFGVLVGLLFLEETHAEKKKQRDRGVELGNRLLSFFTWQPSASPEPKKAAEAQPLLDTEEQLPGYCTTESSPQLVSTTQVPELGETLDLTAPSPSATVLASQPRPTSIFTKQIILSIVTYGILAFHTMTFDQLFPVFLSTEAPKSGQSFTSPIKFVGGFGYDTQTIGFLLAVQGVYSMFSNTVLFPAATKRLGELRLFQLISACYFLLYLVTPYLVLLPDSVRMIGIYVIIVWKCTFSTLAYPSNAIILNNSAPSRLVLGTLNGWAASAASLCRAFGPMISGFLYATGLETGYSGLAWWVAGLVTVGGALLSMQLKEPHGRMDEKVEDVEAGPAGPCTLHEGA